jgi:sulfhydrogenase subunit beta (sulfur reductase)
MTSRVIDKSAVAGFLDDLAEQGEVLAPAERDGLISYDARDGGDEVLLGFLNSKQPPKQIFFPCSETLFTFENGEVTAVPLPNGRRVVFGIRPCDAKSLTLLDRVFDAPDSQDPYYAARRQNTVLIGLGCGQPARSCFCTSFGGGPFDTEGLDLLFSDLGDRFLVESLTAKGEALVVDSPHFREPTEADLELKGEIAARAEATISGPDLDGVKEKLDVMYDGAFWDDVRQKCLACGICSYMCPTCHCFDIVDEVDGNRGRRVRNWDSCQFSLFTLHTSGHNPRPSGKERMRQRIMHKFRYFVDNFGPVACVGCGRCVRECPVNLDIRAVVEAVKAN